MPLLLPRPLGPRWSRMTSSSHFARFASQAKKDSSSWKGASILRQRLLREDGPLLGLTVVQPRPVPGGDLDAEVQHVVKDGRLDLGLRWAFAIPHLHRLVLNLLELAPHVLFLLEDRAPGDQHVYL